MGDTHPEVYPVNHTLRYTRLTTLRYNGGYGTCAQRWVWYLCTKVGIPGCTTVGIPGCTTVGIPGCTTVGIPGCTTVIREACWVCTTVRREACWVCSLGTMVGIPGCITWVPWWVYTSLPTMPAIPLWVYLPSYTTPCWQCGQHGWFGSSCDRALGSRLRIV